MLVDDLLLLVLEELFEASPPGRVGCLGSTEGAGPVAAVWVLQSSKAVGGKGKSLLWPGASQQRIYYHRVCGQLSTTCCDLLK